MADGVTLAGEGNRGERKMPTPSLLCARNVGMRKTLRQIRGWIYRRYPSLSVEWHHKKLAGYERRWGLEDHGHTKEGFFRVFHKKFLSGNRSGRAYELVAGDGLVGSLGAWLEGLGEGWKEEAWEHRATPLASIRKNRPTTQIHEGRLTRWSAEERKKDLVGITTRGAREAAGVCREICAGQIRPQWVGLWNPSMRSTWFHRMRGAGYQLVLVYQRMEFYRDKKR
jgi:hypothetical protein